MQSVINFFGANGFIPHGYCLTWSSGLLWLHALSDVLIVLPTTPSLSLLSISSAAQRLAILVVIHDVRVVHCGMWHHHLFSVITIWVPLYWLEG